MPSTACVRGIIHIVFYKTVIEATVPDDSIFLHSRNGSSIFWIHKNYYARLSSLLTIRLDDPPARDSSNNIGLALQISIGYGDMESADEIIAFVDTWMHGQPPEELLEARE